MSPKDTAQRERKTSERSMRQRNACKIRAGKHRVLPGLSHFIHGVVILGIKMAIIQQVRNQSKDKEEDTMEKKKSISNTFQQKRNFGVRMMVKLVECKNPKDDALLFTKGDPKDGMDLMFTGKGIDRFRDWLNKARPKK